MSKSTLPPSPARFALPQNIRQVLDRVGKKHFLTRIAYFPLLAGAFLPLLWLAQGLTDFVFTLPWAARLVLLLGDLALVGWLLYKHVIIPARQRLNHRTAALLVERTYPQFRTSLISAVQFTSPDAGPFDRSAELIQLLLPRVSRQVDQTDIMRGIVDTRKLWKLFATTMAVIIAVGAIVWYFRPQSLVFARRVFLSQEALPRRTTIVPITSGFMLNTGSDAELSVRASGIVPKSGNLVVIYPDGRNEMVTANLSSTEPGVFSVTLRNVLQSFRYHFEINDGVSEEFEVKTRTLPSLASTKFTEYFQPYTSREPVELSAGSLTLLADGQLAIGGEATQPLKSAMLELKGLNKTIRMDSGDPIDNLRRRVEADDNELAERKAKLEKLRPEATAATQEKEAAQKAFEDAKKKMDSESNGDAKRKLAWEWEKAGMALRKAGSIADQALELVKRIEGENVYIQRRRDDQKQQLDKMIAEQKPLDKETSDKQKRRIGAQIPIPREGLTGISIHLINEEGLASENDPVYRVNLMVDKAPVVDLIEPKSDQKTVLPGDKVRLKFTVRDDFHIEKISLKYAVLRPDAEGAPQTTEEGVIPMDFPKGAPNVTINYVWDLGTFVPPLLEGCTVNYWIEGADYYTLYSPGAGTTRKMSLIVVSPEKKKEELILEMGKAAKQIEGISNRQGKTNEKTNSTIQK